MFCGKCFLAFIAKSEHHGFGDGFWVNRPSSLLHAENPLVPGRWIPASRHLIQIAAAVWRPAY